MVRSRENGNSPVNFSIFISMVNLAMDINHPFRRHERQSNSLASHNKADIAFRGE